MKKPKKKSKGIRGHLPIPTVIRHAFKKNADVPIHDLNAVRQERQRQAREQLVTLFGTATRVDMKIGSVILEGTTAVIGGALSVSGSALGKEAISNAGSGVEVGMIAPIEISKIAQKMESTPGAQTGGATWQSVYRHLQGLWNEVWSQIQDMMNLKKNYGAYAKLAWSICKAFASKICESLGPLGDAETALRGLWRTAKGCVAKMKHHAARHNTSFVKGGHTEVILDVLSQLINRSIGSGIWHTIKGSGGVAAQLFAGPLAKVASVVAEFLELVWKVGLRCYEHSVVKTFLEDAQGFRLFTIEDNVEVFTDWFRSACKRAPVIATTAMTSSYCGDSTIYLGNVNSPQEAKMAQVRLARMRQQAKEYMNSVQLEIRSDNPAIDGYLRNAKATPVHEVA